MKFLLDMPVSPSLTDAIGAYGHEGVHASQIGKAQAQDEELMEIARREGSVIITADLDFPRLLSLSFATGPGLILFRGGNYSDEEMASLLQKVFNTVSPETMAKSICVVDHKRIRITQLPIQNR